MIILLYFVLTSPHSSITTLLVNFGRSFSFRSTTIWPSLTLHRLSFARSIRQKMLCREERSLLSWGKRQKAWKLAAIGFTRPEVWADFQDFWSNLIYYSALSPVLSSSNSNSVSGWVTWQVTKFCSHKLAKMSSLSSAFRKCFKLQNWYQNVLNVAYRTLLVMFCVLKYYFVDFNGMFTSFQSCQIRQSKNACALQSWEKYYFSKQNISSNVLQTKLNILVPIL